MAIAAAVPAPVAKRQATRLSFTYLAWTLGICATVATAIALHPRIDVGAGLFFGSFAVSVALIVAIGMVRDTARITTLRVLLGAFAASEGVFFALVGERTAPLALAVALGGAAAVFAVMAAWGHVTRRNLTTLGTGLFIGLLGLIVALVVSIAFGLGWLYALAAFGGIGLFALYTAYDVHRVGVEAAAAAGDPDMLERIAIDGALALYLDLANLVIDLLRVFDVLGLFDL